jgi:hypothetical protein
VAGIETEAGEQTILAPVQEVLQQRHFFRTLSTGQPREK